MDTQVMAWIASFILGTATVWRLVEKYSPKIRRSIKITGEILELINNVLDALDDKKITKQELQKIANDLEELKILLGK